MISIIEKSKEFDKVDEYLLTTGKGATSIKDVEDNTTIIVDGYLIFEDEKDSGTVEIMSIITPDREVFCTQSQTFKNSLLDMFSIMDGQQFPIIKVSGTTRSGRPYVDCNLDIEKLR